MEIFPLSGPGKSSKFRTPGIVSIRLSKCLWILAQTTETMRAKRRRVQRNVMWLLEVNQTAAFCLVTADSTKWTARVCLMSAERCWHPLYVESTVSQIPRRKPIHQPRTTVWFTAHDTRHPLFEDDWENNLIIINMTISMRLALVSPKRVPAPKHKRQSVAVHKIHLALSLKRWHYEYIHC